MSLLFRIVFFLVVCFQALQTWGFSTSRLDEHLTQANLKQLAFSKAWLRLGHYEKNIFGQWKSSLRGGFFLAVDGAQNPQSELQATLKEFFKTGPDASHAQCRYLARREWLKKTLLFTPDEILSCTEQMAWKKKLDATGVSLIFASADTSSASSIYGHTFMKIIGRNQEQDRDLLNYGVNYAAMATDKEGMLYAVKGLFGFYKGAYTMLPYHEKLREYVNAEGRDIWEYRLSLTPSQVDQLINHLLELRDSWSPYYFGWDNCSYQLLSLLEVANENLELTSHFQHFVIPLDTVKIVSRTPGLVVQKKIRKSLKKDFTENYIQLNARQRKSMRETIASGALPQVDDLPKTEQAEVLDAAMKYYALQGYQDGKKYEQQTYKLLTNRSQLGLVANHAQLEPPSPESSHDSAGIYFGGGKQKELNFASLKLRTAFHDLVSADEALFEFSHNEAFSADIRYYSDQSRWDVQKLTLFDLLTSRPVNDLERPLSWKIQVYTEPKFSPHMQVGFGYSLDFPVIGKTRLIGLASGQFNTHRSGIGPDIFLVHRLKDWFAVMVNYRGSWNNANYQSIWNTQIGIPLSEQLELRVEFAQSENFEDEWQVRVLKQFIL